MTSALDLLRAVVPDLERKRERFTVLATPPDPDLQRIFHEHLPGLVAQMKTALGNGDWSVVRRHAHSIKGMGGGVGYPEISAWGEGLERAAGEPDPALAGRLLDALSAWQTLERAALAMEEPTPP